MKKTLIRALSFCMILALLTGLMAPFASAIDYEGVEPITLEAAAGLLIDLDTDQVLYEQNADGQRYPASITKIMTALLTLEAVGRGELDLSTVVTVDAAALKDLTSDSSTANLKAGEEITVHDLLYCLMLASANEAANILAMTVCGDIPTFVERMNQRAQELGMKDTHFCNCNGLPAEGHVTSAYDIALMSRQLLQYDLIRDYVGIWMDSIREGTFQLANTNKLIYYYDGATGLKTGSTDAAGYCISASAQREGMELIAVVLGSPTSKERFNTAKALLNYGFGAYALADVTPEQPLPALPVQLGQAEQVELALAQTGKLLVKKEERSKVTSELQLEQALKAPVSQGQEVGKLVVSVDGKERMTIPVVTQTQVPRLTFSGMFGSLWRRMATGK